MPPTRKLPVTSARSVTIEGARDCGDRHERCRAGGERGPANPHIHGGRHEGAMNRFEHAETVGRQTPHHGHQSGWSKWPTAASPRAWPRCRSRRCRPNRQCRSIAEVRSESRPDVVPDSRWHKAARYCRHDPTHSAVPRAARPAPSNRPRLHVRLERPPSLASPACVVSARNVFLARLDERDDFGRYAFHDRRHPGSVRMNAIALVERRIAGDTVEIERIQRTWNWRAKSS